MMFGWLRAEAARLLLEAAHQLLVAREVRGQELQRDAAAEPLVFRQIDGAHPARADLPEDAVGAERGAAGHDFERRLLLAAPAR